MHERSQRGKNSESLVAHYLEKQGFRILEKNYTKRWGEIDIIATKSDLLIFVEVKMRTTLPNYFDLSEVITHTKQQKIILVAKTYLAYYAQQDKVCRFDVALVEGDSPSAHITYLEDAFREDEN